MDQVFDSPLLLNKRKRETIEVKIDTKSYENLTEFIPSQMSRILAEARNIVEILLMIVKGGGEVTEPQQKKYSIKEIVRQVINDYGNIILTKKNIKIVEKKDFYLTGKECLIKHILLNLLNNTMHHVGKNASVTVIIESQLIRYRDSGIKMCEENFEFLSQPFCTGTGSEEGYGVGLAFCDAATKLLGGEFIFVNDGRRMENPDLNCKNRVSEQLFTTGEFRISFRKKRRK